MKYVKILLSELGKLDLYILLIFLLSSIVICCSYILLLQKVISNVLLYIVIQGSQSTEVTKFTYIRFENQIKLLCYTLSNDITVTWNKNITNMLHCNKSVAWIILPLEK